MALGCPKPLGLTSQVAAGRGQQNVLDIFVLNLRESEDSNNFVAVFQLLLLVHFYVG